MKPSSTSVPVVSRTRLTDLLIELQVGIRKISMYGLNHSVAPKTAKNLHSQFSEILTTVDSLSFVIGKDDMLYQGQVLAEGTQVIQNLSRMFHDLNLIGITFKKGLSEADLLTFFTFIIENRTAAFTQDDPTISQFHEQALAISFQLVSFAGALKAQNPDSPEAEISTESKGNPWQGLLNRLSGKSFPATLQSKLAQASDGPFDPEKIAWVINALYSAGQAEAHIRATGNVQDLVDEAGKSDYDTAIVQTLKEQFQRNIGDGEQGDQVKQEMAKLFTMIHPEARQKIFRSSMAEQGNQTLPLEDFLDFVPPTLLPEVLHQITISKESVSGPTVSLLKKMVPLSDSDDKLKNLLETKVESHKGLFDELFINRADREYYPSDYRSILDNELIGDPSASENEIPETESKLSNAEIDSHLSLILLEILDDPIGVEAKTERCLMLLKNLLTQGFGEETPVILIKTIRLLLKKCSEITESQALWKRMLKMMISPEIFQQLLAVNQNKSDAEDSGEEDNVADELVRVAGEELFPILLDILAFESNLSTRKQIIQLIVKGGPTVVPLIVEQLSNDKWFIVRNMLVILRDLRAEESIPDILPCLEHASEKVRLAALQALGTLAREKEILLTHVQEALRDPDERVSKTAVLLLASSRHEKARVFFEEQFIKVENGGKDIEILFDVLNTIGRSGPPTWLPVLHRLRKGFSFLVWGLGRKRSLQKVLHKAISEINHREETAHAK